MTRKKSRFFTFIISFMPGAGEMYLGFYKSGTSIMILFLGGLAVFGALIPQLLYLLAVLWFYSFFHTNNLNSLPDDEFYAIEDDYLLSMSPENIKNFCGRYRKYIGILLLLLGVSVAWSGAFGLVRSIFTYLNLPDDFFTMLYRGGDAVAQLIAAVIIVVLGWNLFRAKKESLKTPPYMADRIEKSRETSSAAPREIPSDTPSDTDSL